MDGVVAAARSGDLRKVQGWSEKGKSVDGLLDEACARWAPIHFSAAEGHVVALHTLLTAGANVNLPSPRKTVYNRHFEQLGDGYTPLHLAARFGHADAVDALLRAGADADAGDTYGHSALHYAAAFGHGDAMRSLLQYGALPAPKDGTGATPADAARQAGHADLAAQLEAAAASRPTKARLRDWLIALGLGDHFNGFLEQGFDDVDFIATAGLSPDDLDAIGVRLAGHRKKLTALYRIGEFVGTGAPKEEEEKEKEDEEEDEDEDDDDEEEEEDGDDEEEEEDED